MSQAGVEVESVAENIRDLQWMYCIFRELIYHGINN